MVAVLPQAVLPGVPRILLLLLVLRSFVPHIVLAKGLILGAMDRLLRLDAFVRIIIGVYLHNVQLLDAFEFVQQWTPAKCSSPCTRVQSSVICSIPVVTDEEKACVVNEVAPVVTATGKTKSAAPLPL